MFPRSSSFPAVVYHKRCGSLTFIGLQHLQKDQHIQDMHESLPSGSRLLFLSLAKHASCLPSSGPTFYHVRKNVFIEAAGRWVCKQSVDKEGGRCKDLNPGSRRLLAFRAFLFLSSSTSEAAPARLRQLTQLMPDSFQGANDFSHIFPRRCFWPPKFLLADLQPFSTSLF